MEFAFAALQQNYRNLYFFLDLTKVINYLKLAPDVTTIVLAADLGIEQGMEQTKLSQENKILAPRLIAIWDWGRGTNYTRTELENPANVNKIAREMIANGAHVVSEPFTVFARRFLLKQSQTWLIGRLLSRENRDSQ